MLNELFDLAKTLEKQGLLPERMHPNIYTPKPCDFRISLAEEGNPCSLRVLGKSEASGLWTHGRANHNRFPAVRVQKPLMAQTVSAEFDASAWDKADLARKRSTVSYTHLDVYKRQLKYRPFVWLSRKSATLGSSDHVLTTEFLYRVLFWAMRSSLASSGSSAARRFDIPVARLSMFCLSDRVGVE